MVQIQQELFKDKLLDLLSSAPGLSTNNNGITHSLVSSDKANFYFKARLTVINTVNAETTTLLEVTTGIKKVWCGR